MAAKLIVGQLTPGEIVVFADGLARRGFGDPEIIEILSEPRPELAILALHLRRWAERYGVTPINADDAGFTIAAALAKRFLAGACSVEELSEGMLHLWCYTDCDFEAGGFYNLPEYRSAGACKMSDEEMNSALRKLSLQLIECYEKKRSRRLEHGGSVRSLRVAAQIKGGQRAGDLGAKPVCSPARSSVRTECRTRSGTRCASARQRARTACCPRSPATRPERTKSPRRCLS